MLTDLFNGIEALVVKALNALIAALGAALEAAIALLPDMPALPSPPAEFTTAAAWVSWVFPIDTLLDCLLFALSMWLLWQAVVIALRWAKASE